MVHITPFMKRKVYIETFGCQMNDHDSDRIARSLEANSYEIVYDEALADAVIINTCSIRDKAERKVFSRIGRLANLKRKGRDMILGVTGCMAQRLGREIMDDFKEVDLVFGTHVIPGAAYFMDRAFDGEKVLDTTEKGINEFEFLNLPEKLSGVSDVTANVTIMNGCNNYCSYCIVPYVRGPEVSRKPEEIIREIKNLVSRGVREVTLLGQNVNSYGKGKKGFDSDCDCDSDCDSDCDCDCECDHNQNHNHNQNQNQNPGFVGLLKRVNEIDGLKRIRFVTSHPKDISDELIDLFGLLPKLCEHIHLPVQSGSDKILGLMNRGYTADHYMGLVEKFKKKCPAISITTDIIVGYPGESDEDFEKTLRLVERARFDGSFSFKYSPRPGTASADLRDTVDPQKAQERLDRLQKMQIEMTYGSNRAYIGKEVEALVEGKSKKGGDELFGRTRTNKIVNFLSNRNSLGKLINLKVNKARKNSLYGEEIEE